MARAAVRLTWRKLIVNKELCTIGLQGLKHHNKHGPVEGVREMLFYVQLVFRVEIIPI
jgi:hypothetical protein